MIAFIILALITIVAIPDFTQVVATVHYDAALNPAPMASWTR